MVNLRQSYNKEKNVPKVLNVRTEAAGRGPFIFKTEGMVFLNTDQPRPVNNMFIFYLFSYFNLYSHFSYEWVEFLITIKADKFARMQLGPYTT